MRKTGFVFHELYMWHDTGSAACEVPPSLTVEPYQHIENADAKRRFRNLLEVSGLLDSLVAVKPRYATEEELARAHDKNYIAEICRQSAAGGGNGGDDAPFGRGSYEIAKLSAGGALAAGDAVMSGTVHNAYALVRPPGHHALPARGMGFCLFNNVALLILHAKEKWGVTKIANVDWDVHHGNGTEAIFYDDPSVLTVSMHQDGCFPADSGGMEQRGAGGGNINIPLPAGSGHGAYLAAFAEIVAPALRRFEPDLITVSCGFDAGILDPLARMMCMPETFAAMTAQLLAIADECCEGRVVMCHEGGYSPPFVPYCGLAVMEELSGIKTGVPNPFADSMATTGQQLQPHQRAQIDAIRACCLEN